MATFTKQIDSDIRDVGYTDNSPAQSSALSLGNPGAALRHIALRFTGVTLPQGSTITSAKITFVSGATQTPTVTLKIEGTAEDNTAEFVISPEDTARTRTKTTANVAWTGSISQTNNTDLDTPAITSIVQEIVNRAGWSSGNAMGFWISDNGSSGGNTLNVKEYSTDTTKSAILTIVSPDITSTSTTSTSSSTSTTSTSSSTSITSTSSTTTTLPLDFFGIKISKPGKDVLRTNMPDELIFSSQYGTLKYFVSGTVTISTVIDEVEDINTALYTHNLGYYPYFEAYVLDFNNQYEPIPIIHLGASTSTEYSVYATKTQLRFKVKWTSYSMGSTQTAKFKFFIFRNDLRL